MYTCIIVDDENLAVAHLKRMVATRADLLLVKTFLNSTEALSYLTKNAVDIAFVDVMMPKVSGLNIADAIKEKTFVIFTTSSTRFAFDSYMLNAVDYLLKPILLDRFNAGVDKAITLFQAKKTDSNLASSNTNDFIAVVADRKIYKIQIQDIIYIESMLEYVAYYTLKGKVMSLGSLKNMQDLLPKEHFIRVHKTFIVNKRYIATYNKTKLKLLNDIEIIIGRVYKKQFIAFINSEQSK